MGKNPYMSRWFGRAFVTPLIRAWLRSSSSLLEVKYEEPHTTSVGFSKLIWWAEQGSNLRPHLCKRLGRQNQLCQAGILCIPSAYMGPTVRQLPYMAAIKAALSLCL